jgi:hypothetical protein
MLRVTFEVTAEHGCQIPVLGEFKAGETKTVTDDQIQLFPLHLGYSLAKANFPPWVHLSAVLTEKE